MEGMPFAEEKRGGVDEGAEEGRLGKETGERGGREGKYDWTWKIN